MYPVPGWRNLECFPFFFRGLIQQSQNRFQFKSSGYSINSDLQKVSFNLYVLLCSQVKGFGVYHHSSLSSVTPFSGDSLFLQ